jgi:hypothetical protein
MDHRLANKIANYRHDPSLTRQAEDAGRLLAELDLRLRSLDQNAIQSLLIEAERKEIALVDAVENFRRENNLPQLEAQEAAAQRKQGDGPILFHAALQRGFALGMRNGLLELLCCLHRHGAAATPQAGKIRTKQNWIGPSGAELRDAFYVPPPPGDIGELLGELERFIVADTRFEPILRCGVAFAQMGYVHPFLDGNSRTARLFAPVLIRHYGLADRPFLYLQRYTIKYSHQHVEALNAYHHDNDVNAALLNFTSLVIEAAQDLLSSVVVPRRQ